MGTRQIYTNNQSSAMATQDFNIETFTDVILTYLDESGEEERQNQCHKAILCAKSTYFRDQLEAADSMEVWSNSSG